MNWFYINTLLKQVDFIRFLELPDLYHLKRRQPLITSLVRQKDQENSVVVGFSSACP